MCNNYYEEQALEEGVSIDKTITSFHDYLHDSSLCTIPSLSHKVLLDNGVVYIVKQQPPPNPTLERTIKEDRHKNCQIVF